MSDLCQNLYMIGLHVRVTELGEKKKNCPELQGTNGAAKNGLT